jgi:glycerol-3-phosphate dehydrogenase
VPTVPESDVDFLLSVAGTALDRPLTRADVRGSFAGLRPLVDAPGQGGRSADLSRHHAVRTSAHRVVTVVGGKLTTYRRMAQDAVDAAVAAAGLTAGPSRTDRTPLVGADARARLDTLTATRRLVGRYGTEAERVAAIGELDADLARPVAPGSPITAAEVVWAVRHEGALDTEDVLDRRTRIGLVTEDADAARPVVADLVARTRAGL